MPTTKRLLKRHNRQVSRAKAKVRLSEPDVRTPEQVRAAREASQPAGSRRNEPVPLYASGTAAKDKETV
jgi:hypothetical protein